ncbi:hypothetical protein COOONC_10399 [Cooperia oncophora]
MICLSIYNDSEGYQDLFLYEACMRDLLERAGSLGRIKILPKGTAWARDNWITNSKWNEERDFMMHNWKLTQLRTPLTKPIPSTYGMSVVETFLRNTTWHYNKDLLATRLEIDNRLLEYSRTVDRRRTLAMSRVQEIRKGWFESNSKLPL